MQGSKLRYHRIRQVADSMVHWRFGFKITAQQHYNAFSETGNFSNEVWKNCHDEKIALKGRSHVNIFANDFIC